MLCVRYGRKLRRTPCLVRRARNKFHYANRARTRESPTPSAPAGWLCVAWLEGVDDEDVEDFEVVGDTTEAGLRVLVGDVVVGETTEEVSVEVPVVVNVPELGNSVSPRFFARHGGYRYSIRDTHQRPSGKWTL